MARAPQPRRGEIWQVRFGMQDSHALKPASSRQLERRVWSPSRGHRPSRRRHVAEGQRRHVSPALMQADLKFATRWVVFPSPQNQTQFQSMLIFLISRAPCKILSTSIVSSTGR